MPGIGAQLLDAAIALHETAAADPRGAGRAHDALTDGTLVALSNGEGPLVCGWITLVAADDPSRSAASTTPWSKPTSTGPYGRWPQP